MNYREKIKLTFTLEEWYEIEKDLLKRGATYGQEELIAVLALASLGRLNPPAVLSRGDLSDTAWTEFKRLIGLLRPGPNPPTLEVVGDHSHEGSLR